MGKLLKSSKVAFAGVPFKSPFLPENPKIVGVQEGYDLWSEFYDIENNVLILLEQQYLFPMMLNRSYNSIFDCGCGTGRIAMWLRKHFAESTISGVDFSEGMLRKAHEKSEGKKINWLNADLNLPFPFPDSHFDLIVSSLVIEHISDLANFFTGIKRVAKPGADIFITGLHPFMHLMGISARFKSKDNDEAILPESCCHDLSTIYNSATEAGLRVKKLSEFHVDPEIAAACPTADRYLGMPLLFIMQLEP